MKKHDRFGITIYSTGRGYQSGAEEANHLTRIFLGRRFRILLSPLSDDGPGLVQERHLRLVIHSLLSNQPTISSFI